MLVVGLTGGIGSGKSLAAQFFAELGALVIDADQLARDAIERGSDGFDQLIATFGDSILNNGLVDRRALGELVFRDADAKRKLEGIIHPIVRQEFEEAVASLEKNHTTISWAIDPRKRDDASYLGLASFRHWSPALHFADQHVSRRLNLHQGKCCHVAQLASLLNRICELNSR